jgi:hypothetical protein
MAKRKKRPSLENYLSTGKVHWEDGSSLTKTEKNATTSEEESLSAEPVLRESLSEKELLFLSMLEDGEKPHWELRFRRKEVLFSSLQVMEERRAFADGKRGELFKLRRRKSSLEKIEEEKDIAFPLLALVEVRRNTLCVRCNHVK